MGTGKRIEAIALLLAPLALGCRSYSSSVAQPAHANRGDMGFGLVNFGTSDTGVSNVNTRPGLAAASVSDGKTRPGDALWRVTSNGLLLELCRPDFSAARDCKIASFLGGPNTVAPMSAISTFPVLIDPVNLGSVRYVVSGGDSRTVIGGVSAASAKVPALPWLGVWANGPGGGVHHCRLEGDAPVCRPATLDGIHVVGDAVGLQTYVEGGSTHESLWVRAGNLLHCSVADGKAEPTCQQATLDGAPLSTPLFSLVTMSDHAVASGATTSHVVWLQLNPPQASVVRCEARSGSAPTCKKASFS